MRHLPEKRQIVMEAVLQNAASLRLEEMVITRWKITVFIEKMELENELELEVNKKLKRYQTFLA